MTEIVLAHDQKHVPGHYFSVGPKASPKRNPALHAKTAFYDGITNVVYSEYAFYESITKEG